MARRPHYVLLLVLTVLFIFGLTWISSSRPSFLPSALETAPPVHVAPPSNEVPDVLPSQDVIDGLAKGGSIAPKLENATLKAELGRASWKLFHTMMARFPEQPSADESEALRSYIHLFARLYPCGDCAAHFRKVLAQYPPQTSGRQAAAGWACFVHNVVNERLQKPIFDCNNIGDFYDCGCGEEGTKGPSAEQTQS